MENGLGCKVWQMEDAQALKRDNTGMQIIWLAARNNHQPATVSVDLHHLGLEYRHEVQSFASMGQKGQQAGLNLSKRLIDSATGHAIFPGKGKRGKKTMAAEMKEQKAGYKSAL